MKTQKVIPALVLMASGLFAGPSAHAAPADKVIAVKFSYSKAAPAEVIYKSLEKTARRACGTPGPITFKDRRMAKACENEVIDSVLAKMQRLDVAALRYPERVLLLSSND